MIRYALICDQRHEFEIWFKNSADYDRQRRRDLVACPVCGSVKVEKAIMAPAVARSSSSISIASGAGEAPPEAEQRGPVAMPSPEERELRRKLRELREHLIKNADYVGPRFPEEARKMHYGEIEHRSIYGEASPQEARELRDEGIEFHPLPILPEDRN
jgi:hypothetical protein